MNDIYNKPEKASAKQAIRSRLALLNDERIRLIKELSSVEEDIHTLNKKLKEE